MAYMVGTSRAEDLYAELVSGGEAAIDRFVTERRSEELFIDYKKSADNGMGTKFHHNDRGNLAKAISGFGNSEGGLIVWGVTCQHDDLVGDVPTGKVPISNPMRFVSWLEGAVSGCTLPPHTGVRHHAIKQEQDDKGYAITYIPKSTLAPHECLIEPFRYRYYIRAGSNFEQVPHGVLAGMFGRQPVPSIFYMWGLGGNMTPDFGALGVITTRPALTPNAWLQVLLVNNGVVMARDLYANIQMSGPGEACQWEFNKPQPGWQATESVRAWHAVAQDGYKLAPSACVCGLSILLYLKPPFTDDVYYEITLGCAGAPVQMISRRIARADVEEAYGRFVASDRKRQAGFDLAKQIFGVGDEQNVKDAEE